MRHYIHTEEFKTALERAEREIYSKAYEYSYYNQSLTAELLGVSRGTVIRKLRSWGIVRKKRSENIAERPVK